MPIYEYRVTLRSGLFRVEEIDISPRGGLLDDIAYWRRRMEEFPNLPWAMVRKMDTTDGGKVVDTLSLLRCAVRFRNLHFVKFCLKDIGVDPNDNEPQEQRQIFWRQDAQPLLHECAITSVCAITNVFETPTPHGETVYIATLLIQFGARINAKDRNGRTALHVAATWGGIPSVLRVLLENGADATIRTDDHKLSVLHLAADNVDKAKILLEPQWGINILERTPFGITALSVAVANQCTDVVHLLIEHGVRVVDDENATCSKDVTMNLLPLLLAAQSGNVDLTFIFLKQVVAARSDPFTWLNDIARKELPSRCFFHQLALQIRYHAPWNQYKV